MERNLNINIRAGLGTKLALASICQHGNISAADLLEKMIWREIHLARKDSLKKLERLERHEKIATDAAALAERIPEVDTPTAQALAALNESAALAMDFPEQLEAAKDEYLGWSNLIRQWEEVAGAE